jgi:hypothetical protein
VGRPAQAHEPRDDEQRPGQPLGGVAAERDRARRDAVRLAAQAQVGRARGVGPLQRPPVEHQRREQGEQRPEPQQWLRGDEGRGQQAAHTAVVPVELEVVGRVVGADEDQQQRAHEPHRPAPAEEEPDAEPGEGAPRQVQVRARRRREREEAVAARRRREP